MKGFCRFAAGSSLAFLLTFSHAGHQNLTLATGLTWVMYGGAETTRDSETHPCIWVNLGVPFLGPPGLDSGLLGLRLARRARQNTIADLVFATIMG